MSLLSPMWPLSRLPLARMAIVKKDERCIGKWSSRPDRSQQGPGSEQRRSEDRNADWQDNGSLGSTHRLRQQLEDSRQSQHVVDRDGGVWAEHQAEYGHRNQRYAEANKAAEQTLLAQ